MKDKIAAILNAPTDTEIKAELLEEYIKACCEEYIQFHIERDDLLISALGVEGFLDDIFAVDRREIFIRFKEYLSEKHKKHIL